MATSGLRIEESYEHGVVRLGLTGELDLASSDQLLTRLSQLLGSGARVRIDLSRLEFIDSRGIYALLRAIALGGEAGDERLEIDREVTGTVREVFELTGIARKLWPPTRVTP